MDRSPEFLQKIGTIDCDIVEANPVVWKGELLIFEYIRGYANDKLHGTGRQRCYFNNSWISYFRFRKVSDNSFSLPFGLNLHMGNAYVDGDRMVVTCGSDWGGSRFYQLESKDLIRWTTPRLILDDPRQVGYNTSVCKAGDKFVMIYELGAPKEKVGDHPFTMFFAESKDLVSWRAIDGAVFGFDHYTGGPMVRYFAGYYYVFYLGGSYDDGFETVVARSQDLKNWEYSKKIVLGYGEADYKLHEVFPASEVARVKAANNINASDLDMCEFNGNLELVYSWGNQRGVEFLARAIVPGMTEQQFCESFF